MGDGGGGAMAKIGTGTKDSAWGWHSRLLGRKQQMTPQKTAVEVV